MAFFFNCCCYLFNFFSLSMQYMLAGLQVGFFYTYTSSNCCCFLIFDNHSLKKNNNTHSTERIQSNIRIFMLKNLIIIIMWSQFVASPFCYDDHHLLRSIACHSHSILLILFPLLLLLRPIDHSDLLNLDLSIWFSTWLCSRTVSSFFIPFQ